MSVELTLGDTSGSPPTGNIVKFYDAWDSTEKIGLYPSKNDYVRDNQINYCPTLDGTGIHQSPISDTRQRELIWEYVDLSQFDNLSLGGFVAELRTRIFSVSGLTYYLGASSMGGAYFFGENPIHIKIIDIITEPVPNSANRKMAHIKMRYHLV